MNILSRIPGYVRTVRGARARKTVLPRVLTYIVTFTCNARCIMCDSWKMESPEDLKLDEIERIFDQLPQLDVVRLTGGEPFVRKDLPEIYELARRKLKPLLIHITSNGFLTNRIVEFCETRDKSVPLQLLFSIDGMKEKHNHVRGRETAWDGVMKTINALTPRRKELRLNIAVNQTIVDSDGVEHYRLLHELLKPMGIDHHMVMAYDVSATYSLERDKEVPVGDFSTFGKFSRESLRELIEEVDKDLADLPLATRVAKRYYLKGIANRLLGDEHSPNPKCVALTAHMRMYPNGDVPTCQFNSQRVGNLRRQSFEDVWFGSEIEKNRDWVRKCAGCWAECEVLPSAIYTGDLLRHGLTPLKNYDDESPELLANRKPGANLS